LSFIDSTIAQSLTLLLHCPCLCCHSFCDIVWSFWKELNLCRFLSFAMYCRWRSCYQEGRVLIPFTGLTPPYFYGRYQCEHLTADRQRTPSDWKSWHRLSAMWVNKEDNITAVCDVTMLLLENIFYITTKIKIPWFSTGIKQITYVSN
jgi:hypothetical protein